MFTNSQLSITKLLVTGSLALSITSSVLAGENDIARGKYLVEIGGCNDCHTAGFAPSGGLTPESQWLLGDSMGYKGGWGTTYPLNLRKYIGLISENDWTLKAKTLKTRPPMPWWSLNAMTEKDLRAIYKYIKSLGVIDSSVPAYVPPGEKPTTPYIQWPLPPK